MNPLTTHSEFVHTSPVAYTPVPQLENTNQDSTSTMQSTSAKVSKISMVQSSCSIATAGLIFIGALGMIAGTILIGTSDRASIRGIIGIPLLAAGVLLAFGGVSIFIYRCQMKQTKNQEIPLDTINQAPLTQTASPTFQILPSYPQIEYSQYNPSATVFYQPIYTQPNWVTASQNLNPIYTHTH